jgi:hypothetical protein
MEESDHLDISGKPYKVTKKTKTSYFSITTTIVLILILIYLILVAYLLSRISNGHFDSGSYYSAVFWVTIIAILVVFGLLIYAAYKMATGEKHTTYKEIDTSQETVAPSPKSSQRLTQQQIQEQQALAAKHQTERNLLAQQHANQQLAQRRGSQPTPLYPSYSSPQTKVLPMSTSQSQVFGLPDETASQKGLSTYYSNVSI